MKEALAKSRGATPAQMVDVIYDACKNKGGLSSPTSTSTRPHLAEAAHLMLPSAHPGETWLTSMNGERRLRLSEKFMDPPGTAKADCLIAADIANTMKRVYEAEGKADMAKRFAGFDWKTEEDAFNDGFRIAGTAGRSARSTAKAAVPEPRDLRAAARCRQQRRTTSDQGVHRRQAGRYRDAVHGRQVRYRGRQGHLQIVALAGPAEVVADQKAKHKFWINNGRVNEVWQTAITTCTTTSFAIAGRWRSSRSIPTMRRAIGVARAMSSRSTTTMARPTRWPISSPIKRSQTFMQFGYFNGIVGDVVTAVDRPQRHPLLQGDLGQHAACWNRRRVQGHGVFQRPPLVVAGRRQDAGPPPVRARLAGRPFWRWTTIGRADANGG